MTHADVVLVLILAVLLLVAGSLSMLVLRLTTSDLRGVGRFSAAFGAAALGLGFQLVYPQHGLTSLGTDVALLSSFVLMHTAVLRIAESRAARLWHGVLLIATQAAVDLLCMAGVAGPRLRKTTIGLLIAVQALTTITTLKPLLRGALRAPTIYCITLLLGFAGCNVLRSAVALCSPVSKEWNQWLGFVAFALFLVVEIGLAFGFFWMTTSNLTAELQYVASTDPLTRVANRRVFMRWCEKELLRSQRSGVPFSLLMVDLDHFKQVNDNFGHQRGDEVLVAAVERMQDSIRGIDVLCRWGGEEFAVLLPNAPAESTLIVAERIRENISRLNIQLHPDDSETILFNRLTVSIGATTFRDVDDDVATMLERADKALYSAKGAGRNRVLITV